MEENGGTAPPAAKPLSSPSSGQAPGPFTPVEGDATTGTRSITRAADSITERDKHFFWRNTGKRGPDECWYNRRKTSKGYSSATKGSTSILAHRFSYELHKGLIPDGMMVLHSCDARGCVNPAHLRLGSAKENTDDAYSRRRLKNVLTLAQEAELCKLKASGKTYKELVEVFGVSKNTAFRTVHGVRRTKDA